MAVRTRKDAWKLPTWDPILLWYARAVADMKTRKFVDPTSWRFQAAIHDYVPADDPFKSAADPAPPAAVQKQFWRKCQHFSWFFLPWHRMYLHYFESIVAATVVKLGGPHDWALPYWNYSDASNPNARKLPPAFIAAKLPDGSPNALRVTERDRGDDGGAVATANQVNLDCLKEPIFQAAPTGGDTGFGGPKTGFNHSSGTRVGALESVPHGSIHNAVGGWMSAFDTAGLDPIFWAHHCNIDRLWEVWLHRNAAHKDPTDAAWLTKIKFDFHDAHGTMVTLTPSQVLDTKAAPLFYQYEDISDPLAAAPTAAEPRIFTMETRPIPEMVGATGAPVKLSGRAVTTGFTVKQPTGPAAVTAAAHGPRRTMLNIENIKAKGRPEGYSAYVNVPEGESPEQHPELFAGHLPLFGIDAASSPEDEHAGEGLHYAFDISNVVRTLEARNAWDPAHIRVTLVPEVPPGGKVTARAAAEVEVGRISLYLE